MGRFVSYDVLSLGCFVPWDVLSLETFCQWDLKSRDLMSLDVLSWDVLSVHIGYATRSQVHGMVWGAHSLYKQIWVRTKAIFKLEI